MCRIGPIFRFFEPVFEYFPYREPGLNWDRILCVVAIRARAIVEDENGAYVLVHLLQVLFWNFISNKINQSNSHSPLYNFGTPGGNPVDTGAF